LGGGIVDAYLKHRKTALQFDRTLLGTFLRAELGLQATIDFKGETDFGQFIRSVGHSENRGRWQASHLVKVSLARPTSLIW
jgi:hypothetical protein